MVSARRRGEADGEVSHGVAGEETPSNKHINRPRQTAKGRGKDQAHAQGLDRWWGLVVACMIQREKKHGKKQNRTKQKLARQDGVHRRGSAVVVWCVHCKEADISTGRKGGYGIQTVTRGHRN